MMIVGVHDNIYGRILLKHNLLHILNVTSIIVLPNLLVSSSGVTKKMSVISYLLLRFRASTSPCICNKMYLLSLEKSLGRTQRNQLKRGKQFDFPVRNIKLKD